MNGSSARKTSASETQAGFWRRLTAHPVFLIAALVVGVGLLFGAPLLAQHEDEHGSTTAVGDSHDAIGAEPATGHLQGEAGKDPSAEAAHGGEEEGEPHPPTLVSLVANLVERSYRNGLSGIDRSEHAEVLAHPPHEAADYLSPAARLLVTYQAPIYSLIVIILLCALSIAGTRNMTMMPGKKQNLLEMVVEGLDGFIKGILGPEGGRFVPFLGTLFLYIYFQNILGLIPLLYTPTSVLDTTLAMAVCVFLYVQWVGITSNGPVGYLRHLAGDPKDAIGWGLTPLMLPLHIVGELAKPVSLSLRLFGNMMGEETLIAIFMGLGVSILAFTHLPVGVPLQIPFIFLALITTLVQALVFFLLSTIYFALVLPHEEHGHDEAEHTGGLPDHAGGR